MRKSKTHLEWVRSLAAERLPIAALTACWIAVQGAPLIAADVAIPEIKAHWEKREEQFRSFHLKWEESVFYKKGSSNGPFDSNDRPNPPEDTVVNFNRSLLCDQGRIRIVDDGKYRSGERGFLPTVRTTVWNGAKSRTFTDFEDRFDMGYMAGRRNRAYEDAQFKPPLMACWPLTAFGGIRLDSYRVTKSIVLDGVDVVVLQTRNLAGRDDQEIWLKAEPPFLLVRALRYMQGVPKKQTEISYATDSQDRWYPQSWKRLVFDKVGFSKVTDAKVTSCEFDPAVNESDFQLEFPAGTWVHDMTRPDQPTQFLMKKDRTRRVILDEELRRGATYRDLMETETGKAYPGPKEAAIQ